MPSRFTFSASVFFNTTKQNRLVQLPWSTSFEMCPSVEISLTAFLNNRGRWAVCYPSWVLIISSDSRQEIVCLLFSDYCISFSQNNSTSLRRDSALPPPDPPRRDRWMCPLLLIMWNMLQLVASLPVAVFLSSFFAKKKQYYAIKFKSMLLKGSGWQ